MSDDYDDDLFNAYDGASDVKPPTDQQDNYDEEFADALDTAVTDNTSDLDPSSGGMDVDRQRQQQNRPQNYNSQQRYYQQSQQPQQPNMMMGGMPYQMVLAYQQQMQQYMAANPLQFQMMQQQFRQMQQQQQYQQQRRPYQQQPYQQRQGNNEEQTSEGKMFIGGLNWDTTDDGLKDYFTKFGEVATCTVMRDPMTGQSRGFGFLTMVNPDDVEQVLKQSEHFLDGKKIDPKRAVSRSEQAQQPATSQPERSEKIFVGGISPDVNQEEFRAYFERFGTVVEATLMVDRETGRPRGFGFITFDDAAAVERALEATDLVIKDKQVEIKRAMPKTKRVPGAVAPAVRPNSRYAGAAMMYPPAASNPYAAMAANYYGRMNNGNSYQQDDDKDDDHHDDRRRHYHSSSSSSSSRRHRDSSRDDRHHRSSSRQPYDDRSGGGAVHASSSSRNQSSYRPY